MMLQFVSSFISSHLNLMMDMDSTCKYKVHTRQTEEVELAPSVGGYR